jgi:hypothetical protein
MEVGAFLLFLVLVVVVVGGGLLLTVAWRLRRAKLDPEEDKIESEPSQGEASRPRHRRVSNEQRSEFLTER